MTNPTATNGRMAARTVGVTKTYGVLPSAVIAAFGVGIMVTVVAAPLPALRASRISPMAALQEIATPDRPGMRVRPMPGDQLPVPAEQREWKPGVDEQHG